MATFQFHAFFFVYPAASIAIQSHCRRHERAAKKRPAHADVLPESMASRCWHSALCPQRARARQDRPDMCTHLVRFEAHRCRYTLTSKLSQARSRATPDNCGGRNGGSLSAASFVAGGNRAAHVHAGSSAFRADRDSCHRISTPAGNTPHIAAHTSHGFFLRWPCEASLNPEEHTFTFINGNDLYALSNPGPLEEGHMGCTCSRMPKYENSTP